MSPIVINMYLVLVHALLLAFVLAWAFGNRRRAAAPAANSQTTAPSGISMVTQSLNEAGMQRVDASDFPGWDKDTRFHFVRWNETPVVEITEFKDGIAMISVTDHARGHVWLFNRLPTMMGKPAPAVSLTRREPAKDPAINPQLGRVIDTLADNDGDGIMDVQLVRSSSLFRSSTRYRLRPDAWEPWPWSKSDTDPASPSQDQA